MGRVLALSWCYPGTWGFSKPQLRMLPANQLQIEDTDQNNPNNQPAVFDAHSGVFPIFVNFAWKWKPQ